MSKEQQKDLGKFFVVGAIATALDYLLLNIFAVVLGLPVIVANSISAPFSSFISYKLNKRVVFEDRMHGKRRTLLLYVAIIGTGILIIQNILLNALEASLARTLADLVMPVLTHTSLPALSETTVTINIAKAGASFASALWNFFMLRRFVFVTKDDLNTA